MLFHISFAGGVYGFCNVNHGFVRRKIFNLYKFIKTKKHAEYAYKHTGKQNVRAGNAKAKNVKSVKANLDLDKIKLDGDKLLGFDDQIEALKKSDAYLFDIDNTVDNGVENNGGNPRKREGGSLNDDELDKLSDEEYFALQEKNKK